MCNACYQAWWKAENKERFDQRMANRRRADCHPDRPLRARGMCDKCYRQWWRSNPDNQAIERERGRIAQQAKYQARPRSERRAIILSKYGITPDDYDLILEQQDNRCAACHGYSNRVLEVDHCHETGKIRGLLCHNCNSALGHAKDDVNRLWDLVEYLGRAGRD